MTKFKCMLSAILLFSGTAVFAQESTATPVVPVAPVAPATPEAPVAPATSEAPSAPVASVAPTVPEVSGATAGAIAQPKMVEVAPEISAAIGSPAPGKALVVFFRPSAFVGSMIGFIVREEGVELGKLRNGNYFTLQAEPGKHAYVVHSEAKDVTMLELEEGETYFLEGELNMGILAGRPNLSPSDLISFSAAFKKLKPSKPLK